MKIPAIAIAEIIDMNFQSIGCRPISPAKPIREFRAIIRRDVPIAFFIGNFIKMTKAGIKRNPPPAPKKPVTRPMSIP